MHKVIVHRHRFRALLDHVQKRAAIPTAIVHLCDELSVAAAVEAAGIVMGATVPIILTSRADSQRARIASCALAVLVVQAGKLALVES